MSGKPADGRVLCPKCGRAFSETECFCPYDGTRLGNETPPPPPPGGAAARQDPLVGRVLSGRYEIVAPLGSGGMATVFVARHTMLDRMHAIKVLKRNLPSTSRAADRFRREARACSRIEHENVVFLTDFGVTEDGLQYMVMEYVAGRPLGEMVKAAGRLPWRRAARIGLQLAGALEAAHSVGIIHRDLKPENIVVVDPGGRDLVKVLDFGIAALVDPDSDGPASKLTRAGMVFGTPEYMSPEHAQGLPLDGRSDLYALGLMVWECLVGRRAVQGRSPPETMALQLSHDPGPPSRQAGVEGAPEALDELVCRLFAKDADDRPASAGETIAAFESLLEASERVAAPMAGPRPKRTAATVLDASLGEQLRRQGFAVGKRDARAARESLVLALAEELWGERDRSEDVQTALDVLEASSERLLDVETDLALVEDEVSRVRAEHAKLVRRMAADGASPKAIGEVRDREEWRLAELGGRGDVLRARAGRLGREREVALTTVALLVLFARGRVAGLEARYEELEGVNREVAEQGATRT